MDRIKYINELKKIVVDRETYTLLLGNLVIQYKSTLEALVKKGSDQGILNEKEQIFLKPRAQRVPVLYCLPKIHKSLTCPPIYRPFPTTPCPTNAILLEGYKTGH